MSNTSQTYSGLINHEAKKYTIAYSQCENIHYVQQKNKNNANNKVVSKEVKNHAEAVKKDKPADLADMFTMATENNINLKIVDDPDYQLSEKDIAKGTKVVVFTKGKKDVEGKDDVGHYQLLRSDGKLIDIESNENDCGYAVFVLLTGKSVDQLRNETAQGIEANYENFSKAIDAQVWVRDHYPQEANSLLFIGAGFSEVWKWIKNNKMLILDVSLTVACIAFPACAPLKMISYAIRTVRLVKVVRNGYDKYQNGENVVIEIGIVADLVSDVICKIFPGALGVKIGSLCVKTARLSCTIKQGYDKQKKEEILLFLIALMQFCKLFL